MDYLQLAYDVVAQARLAGVEAEAFIGVSHTTHIQVARGQVEKLSDAGIKGLGVRVLKGGQMGYAYTSDFSSESLANTVADALALAAVATPDAHRMLPEPQDIPAVELEIYDPAIVAKPLAEKIVFAQELEAAALAADQRVALTDRTSYGDGAVQIYLVNSKGFAGNYEKSFAHCYLRAVAKDQAERAWAHGGHGSTVATDLDAARIGTEVGQIAARLLGGRALPTQEASVVFSPVAAADFLSVLARALTAEAMHRNRSFLQGKMGQAIASDRVTLLDNGRLRRGLASQPFDDEGVPTSATRLINEGVLQAVLYDTYTAHKDSTHCTGNARRPFHYRPPWVASSNFYLQPGSQTPAALIAEVRRGLYVVDAVSSGSSNPTTGDYSVAARGFWIEDGQLAYPVNEVTLALPLETLLQNITAVGQDLEFRGRSIGSPTVRVDGVVIGGQG